MLCLSQRRDNVGGESGELLRSRPGEQSCATMLVSSPEGVNSELLEELMSSEGESLSLLSWCGLPRQKTMLCDFPQLAAL